VWFRAMLLIVSVGLWSLTLWLATHSSENGQVLSRYSHTYFAFLAALAALSTLFTILPFGKAYRWVHSKRHNLLLLVLSLGLSVGLVEFVIRVLDPIGIAYYEYANDYHLDKIADDEMYYRHKPHLDRIYQGVPVQTNALGLRDDPILDKEPNEYRILFLGDSVTFAWGVRQEDGFVHRVGEILEDELGRPIRTINAGVGSYNTDNENAALQRYGNMLQPDIVVLTYVSNDIDPTPDQAFNPWLENSYRDKSPPQVLELLLGKTWTYRLISHLARYRTGGAQTNLAKSSVGWQQSVNALQSISDYCSTRSIPFIVIMYRMAPNQPQDDIARELGMLSRNMNFYYGDTLPWFDGRDISSLINSPVDSHPNVDGHAILAKGIVSELQQNVFSDH